MLRITLNSLLLFFLCSVTTVEANKDPSKKAQKFESVDWVDLLPKSDYDALSKPPSYITDIEDGSAADRIGGKLNNKRAAPKDDPYQQALVSTKVVKKFNGKAVKIPGFVVPLEFDDELSITEFFLVPWYGACLHLPPPPPNQIIFVRAKQGIKVDALIDPFWISGILQTQLKENELAISAYSMTMHSHEIYKEK